MYQTTSFEKYQAMSPKPMWVGNVHVLAAAAAAVVAFVHMEGYYNSHDV